MKFDQIVAHDQLNHANVLSPPQDLSTQLQNLYWRHANTRHPISFVMDSDRDGPKKSASQLHFFRVRHGTCMHNKRIPPDQIQMMNK